MEVSTNWKQLLGFVVCGVGVLWVAVVMSQAQSVVSASEESSETLRHVVMFKFKESSTEQDIARVVDAFGELPKKIPEIHEFEFGTDNSPEGLAKGFTHCFLVTFKSEEDRAVYLPHAAHLEFVEVLKPHMDDVLVIDYWAKN